MLQSIFKGMTVAAVVFLTVSADPSCLAGTDTPYDYFGGLTFQERIPAPEEVLGYRIGERFTRHADVGEYLQVLAAASGRMTFAPYGKTHEGRALWTATISSPANLARLDEILEANRTLADPDFSNDRRIGEIIENNPAIVWFSYNVHGNEPSPTETAMQVAYTMAAAANPEVLEILDNVVLIIDPVLNPDGRERYVNWYNGVVGMNPNSDPDAAEHDEPWPGGRTNHYYFDLNRDWVWLVHPESQARLKWYQRFLPQLHIDYHEQGTTSPFFLGAGDDPYNHNIPAETREWIELYGDANAAVFDHYQRIYATKERFDYLYPGYGKVMPTYYGAVGMLAEKAGHSSAGLAIELTEQHTLTLTERARDHFLLSMSNLETTAANRRGQLERFRRFYSDANAGTGSGPNAFFIRMDTDGALLKKVWDLCSSHGIRIEALTRAASPNGLHGYDSGEEASNITLPAGTWFISAAQPMGNLVRALFERETAVDDERTYDITGWSVPIAFGLDAFYSHEPYSGPTHSVNQFEPTPAALSGEGNVAILVDSGQHEFPRAIGLAVTHDLTARAIAKPIAIDGRSFPTGSLLVHFVDNPERDLDAFLDDVLAAGLNVHRTDTGLTEEGPVLGANEHARMRLPKVLLVRGSPTSSNSFGQHWHLLDVASPVPYTAVDADRLGRVDLDDFTVIVVPDGGGLSNVDRIKSWINSGGALVASGGSAGWAYRSILELETPEPKEDEDADEEGVPGDDDEDEDEDEDADDDDETEDETEDEDDDRPDSERSWRERKDRLGEERISGAMVKIAVDTTHPLAAGVRDWMGIIKRGGRALPVRDTGYVVARFVDEPGIGGVITEKSEDNLERLAFMTHHRMGRGAVILLADDVTLRGFQHAPMRLLLNAIIYGPSLGRF
ncbi:MAG: hypothetical protein D8M59_12940 [Planctomycetes bacterium]|nr:hypothetical protein [Planctomycetota bacterium]